MYQMYLDKNGKPITREEWSALFGNMAYKRIAHDPIPGGHLSTVWLGLNHAVGEGPPLIFESLTFWSGEEVMQRYSTLEEAAAGHAELLERLHKPPTGWTEPL